MNDRYLTTHTHTHAHTRTHTYIYIYKDKKKKSLPWCQYKFISGLDDHYQL